MQFNVIVLFLLITYATDNEQNLILWKGNLNDCLHL